MKDDPSYAKGIIIKTTASAKMGVSIHYQFVVDNQLHEGCCLKRNRDFFNIGDSCLIIFAENDISVNSLYRDKLGYLKLINNRDTLQVDWTHIDSLLEKSN